MPRNIEIKARIDSVEALIPVVSPFSKEGPVEILQDDTFFNCAEGRLKLRAFPDNKGELIFYRRANQQGPKESFYVRSPTASPDSLREALSLALGQLGRVQKKRTLFIVGRTRVHLDKVKDLGDFLELEVVLKDGEDSAAGVEEASRLMTKLGVDRSRLIECAYLDLLSRR